MHSLTSRGAGFPPAVLLSFFQALSNPPLLLKPVESFFSGLCSWAPPGARIESRYRRWFRVQRCIPAVLPLLGPFQGRRVWPCGRNAGLRRSLIARLPPLMYTVARGIRLILVAPDGSRCRRECRRARAAHSVRLGPAPTGPSGLRAESGGAASVPRHSGKGLVALFPAQRHPPARSPRTQ